MKTGDFFQVRTVLLLTALFLFSINYCFADELRLDKDTKFQKDIMQTGFKILNSNNIKKRMTFYYVSENKPKTKINSRLKRVYVYKGMMPYIEDENDLAAIISVETARLLDLRSDFFRMFSVSFSPRKYEIKADKKAVDLMVKAGYDPVALINILNKTSKEEKWFEYNIFHHNGSERMKNIYQYIYEKYPVYLAENKYIETDYYQNFLRLTKNDRKKVSNIQEQKIKKQGSKTTS